MTAGNIKIFYVYPGASFLSYNLETKEYAVYISGDEAEPAAAVARAMEAIKKREREVAV